MVVRKTRDLFKKMRAVKGTFHAKMGTKKDRNRSKEIKKREVAGIHRRAIQKSS